MGIEYYFSPLSGYAYLGHHKFLDIAEQSGAEVRFCPVDIAKVFAASGTTPPARQSEARIRYRQEDMARYARLHSLPINITPKFWPTDSTLGCKAIIAAKRLGLNQGDVSAAILKGVWVMDADISDPHSLAVILREASLPDGEILDGCSDTAIGIELENITNSAIEQGVFGSPTYVFDNERFWGQDRLEMLRERMAHILLASSANADCR